MSGKAATKFAPAQRASREQIEHHVQEIAESPLMETILDAFSGYLLILNEQRQVLAANQRALDDLGISEIEAVLGERPGELLNCVNAGTEPGGCGTSSACSTCGAVISILSSQEQNASAEGECLMTVTRDGHTEALEFRVRAAPMTIGEFTITLFVLHDISGEKRRDALERTFIHDLLNTIGGLAGWSRLLGLLGGVDSQEAVERILALSQRLIREVEDHRVLLQAETGDLEPVPSRVEVAELFGMLETVFREHKAAAGKRVEIAAPSHAVSITTDPSLLLRVLTNMVKNALEAVQSGVAVRVWFEERAGHPTFLVWNPGSIPEHVALQIFRRSFTTKSEKGRGLGTYSMKLFGERYLGGEVAFESSAGSATTFSIALPKPKEPNARA